MSGPADFYQIMTQIDVIILVRHGEPALSRKTRMNWRGYKFWWGLYDEGGLTPGQEAPQVIKNLARSSDIVIASPLRRAVETASLAKDAPPDRLEPLMVEAGLPPPNLGYLRLKPPTWGVLSRICWMMGFSGEVESQAEAKLRAAKMAKILAEEAEGGKTIFVAAHGWFNRMMRPALKKRGFRCVEDHGDLHWSYRRYERIQEEK
ncbi:MAG: hypothetical protein COA91_05790 [Robiginitomaculum sp.]|nr:MAG: hypothetical protein COA91_05790 [Robiginitomaculum sp.]